MIRRPPKSTLTAPLFPTPTLFRVAGSGARDVATTVVANAQRRPDVGSFAGLWSTVLLFIGATAVFARLQTALNLIFHSDARQLSGPWAWLRKRVLSFG